MAVRPRPLQPSEEAVISRRFGKLTVTVLGTVSLVLAAATASSARTDAGPASPAQSSRASAADSCDTTALERQRDSLKRQLETNRSAPGGGTKARQDELLKMIADVDAQIAKVKKRCQAQLKAPGTPPSVDDGPPLPGPSSTAPPGAHGADTGLLNKPKPATPKPAGSAAQVGGGSASPVKGTITKVSVQGKAVSGDMPGPDGSQPFRLGVAQPLPDGTFKVVTTSTPAFRLPPTDGVHTFLVGPPNTTYPVKIDVGQIPTYDYRGGEQDVVAAVPGDVLGQFVGTGLTQNPGYIWGPPNYAEYPGYELLMTVTIQPTLDATQLKAARKALQDAAAAEDKARKGGTLAPALTALNNAKSALDAANAGGSIDPGAYPVLSGKLAAVIAIDTDANDPGRTRASRPRLLNAAKPLKKQLITALGAAIRLVPKR